MYAWKQRKKNFTENRNNDYIFSQIKNNDFLNFLNELSLN